MKKNTMMRLASFLLIAVLISTSAISGTYAKYVTTSETSDTARVAKWGIALEVTGEDVFAEEYDGTVKTSVAEQKLVAPGTKNNTGVTFKITGQPEVAFKLTAALNTTTGAAEDVFLKAGTYPDYTTADNTDDTFELADDYYPVVFKLVHTYVDGGWPILTENVTAGQSVKIGDYDSTKIYAVECNSTAKTVTVTGTLADINAVLAQVSGKMTQVNPNYKLEDTFNLTWEWVFGDSANNKADTMLGNIAADSTKYAKVDNKILQDGTDYNLDLNYNFNITVAQVD